jgi:hypothetical protein
MLITTVVNRPGVRIKALATGLAGGTLEAPELDAERKWAGARREESRWTEWTQAVLKTAFPRARHHRATKPQHGSKRPAR